MQRRSAARSAAAGEEGLPLTVADVSNGRHANNGNANGTNKMKLRRRKRKVKRTSMKKRRARRNLARLALCACVSIATALILSLLGRGPFSGRSSSSLADGSGLAPLRRMLFTFEDDPTNNPLAKCDDPKALALLDRPRLDKSLALGLGFLSSHQRSAGNFDYEYDWVSGSQSEDDSSVRQAGALWGMALIFHDMMDHAEAEGGLYADGTKRHEVLKDVAARLKRGFEFFKKNSRLLNRPIDQDDDHASALVGINKMRYVTYPGEKSNGQGCQALVCLALIDFLRGLGSPTDAAAAGVTADEMDEYRTLLDEFLPFMATQHSALSEDRFDAWDEMVDAGTEALESGIWYGEKVNGKKQQQSVDLQMEKWWDENLAAGGAFHSKYDLLGKRSGKPSSYYDGESLLAVTKAAKYLGPAYAHLWPLAAGTAHSLHDLHIDKALEKDEDSDETKGCYQWLSMSLFELTTVKFGTGRKERFDLPAAIQRLYRVEKFGSWLMDLAVWMVDVHETLRKGKNTGYAYEGIAPAWSWGAHMIKAGIKKDKHTVSTVRNLHCTIHKGMDKLIGWQVGMGAEKNDEWDGKSGLGGIQNSAHESGLRIDVTQHQMHATILTRRLVYPKEGAAWPWKAAAATLEAQK